MEKAFLFLILFLFALSFVSGIKITEVELNPVGTDSGNEWIEFYNINEISLDNYSIVNNDGDFIALNGSFEGYFKYVFGKQWLDNSDEKVILYKNDEMIFETYLFEDKKDTGLTWQFCGGEWVFQKGTPGSGCVEKETDSENPQTQDTQETSAEETNRDEDKSPIEVFQEKENSNDVVEEEIILLGFDEEKEKDIKTNPDNELSKSLSGETPERYAPYIFLAFCVLILGLFAAKKFGKNKNEFG